MQQNYATIRIWINILVIEIITLLVLKVWHGSEIILCFIIFEILDSKNTFLKWEES